MHDSQKNKQEIRDVVREFILQEFLEGEDPYILQDDTALMTGGILDSIANARLVSHLETYYDIRFKPHEMQAEHVDTVERIVRTVERKIREGRTG